MAYSRWSHSHWYTYWSCHGGDTKDEQALQIYPRKKGGFFYTYKELTTNLSDVLEDFKALGTTQDHIDELKKYIEHFIEDVEDEFSHE